LISFFINPPSNTPVASSEYADRSSAAGKTDHQYTALRPAHAVIALLGRSAVLVIIDDDAERIGKHTLRFAKTDTVLQLVLPILFRIPDEFPG
jgi:hypothetical protein